MADRLARLRYKICCWDGWRWREGYAIRLPRHPHVRICVRKLYGRWAFDSYDTGFALGRLGDHRTLEQALRALKERLPWLLAGGRWTKLLKPQRAIRRARALGEARHG
jgi:hypothetical protein